MAKVRTGSYPGNMLVLFTSLSLFILFLKELTKVEWLMIVGGMLLAIPILLITVDVLLAVVGLRSLEFYLLWLINLFAHSVLIDELKEEL